MGGCQLVPLGDSLYRSQCFKQEGRAATPFALSTNARGPLHGQARDARVGASDGPPPEHCSPPLVFRVADDAREILDPRARSALGNPPRTPRNGEAAEGTAGGSLRARPYGDYPRPVLFIAATRPPRRNGAPRSRARVPRVAPENSGG